MAQRGSFTPESLNFLNRSIGDAIRRLLHLANVLDAATMHDRIEYLSDW